MRGATQGTLERIVVQAHWNETLARQKNLKPPQHYLRQVEQPGEPAGGSAVLARLRRFQAKQQARPQAERQGGDDGVQ